MSRDPGSRWNHNTHYYPLVLSVLPAGAGTALDVGTGDGLLAVALRERVCDVTGIDCDSEVLQRARRTDADVRWVLGDVLSYPLPEAHFDLVAAMAAIHHMPDLAGGLRRLASLTAPGGVLVIIGCARSSSLRDIGMDMAGTIEHRIRSRKGGYWQHTAPVRTQFPHTYAETRQTAAAVLPGMTWRRLPLFRYIVSWHRPI